MSVATWADPDVGWGDPYTTWSGHPYTRPWSHVLDLGLDVSIGRADGVWILADAVQGVLGTTSRLAATAEMPGTWQPLDCDLVEVTWQQGATGSPEHVMPRAQPGTLTATVVDPGLNYLPGADLAQGLRPGRPVRLVDRADGRILWTGWTETATWDLSPADPLHHLRLTAVDVVTRVSRRARVEAGRAPETAASRVAHLMDTYAPDIPYTADPAATTIVAGTVAASLWDALLDAAAAEIGWLWPTRDGGVVLTDSNSVFAPPVTWEVVDPCLPVLARDATWDAMGWGTRWTVTRRKRDDDDAPVPQTATNQPAESAHGGWWADPITDYPVDNDADAMRAADAAASWRGWPRLMLSGVAVDVGAAATMPTVGQLLALVRDAELGDAVNLDPFVPDAAALATGLILAGWSWTWSAAGALTGVLGVELLATDSTLAAYWLLGTDHLDTTTVLAPGGA